MIIVPCHRVTGKNGSLIGFGGGMQAKEYLLHLESTAEIVYSDGQINISGINQPD